MNSIETLKILTEELPPIPTLSSFETNIEKGYSEYVVEEGLSFGHSLYNRPEVAVMRMFVSKGTKWPNHVHDNETEWLMVYKGSIKVRCDNEEDVTLVPGSAIEFCKNKNHYGEALEDTWLIAVSIPRVDGYPK